MTDQVVWSGDTRTEVSKLVISTNELTSKVITLLNAISGNFDGLVGQLEEATSAVNGGVADLSNIKADIESSIRRAQEDMGNIYKSFLTDSTDIKSTLSGLSTDAEEVKLILVTLDNTSKVLSDKYAKLNSTAEEVGTYVLLYKNQASTIQESILGLEARAATISANLDRVSEMAQLNTESSEEFMQQLSTMKVDVYNLSASVSEYTDLAKELVDSYSRLTQVATEASTTATAAYNDAVNAMDKVIVLADQYDGLNAVASQIKTLIGEYNSIAADLTSQLSSMSGEVTNTRSVIDEFSDFVSSSVTTLNSDISTLTSKIATLTLRVEDLVVKIDGASETIYSIKSMVDVQLQDALTVINNATLVAENVATKAASADTSIEECLGILGVAKTDTDLIFSNLTAYKDEVGQIYSETMAHISSVESSLVVLDFKATTITEQLNSALDVTTAISSHVDDVKTHVDEVASTIETVYLKKVDQAVDSALLSGKAIDYFLHDDNSETKLSTSPTIQQMQTAIGNINDVIQSDTGTLDTLQEIVDFIKLNKATLDSLNIGNIAGLQTALDGKLATDANAVSASKWEVARKITLGGALSGFVDLDGSADATLNATIVDIAAVPSLVDALAAKLDKTGVAADSTMFDGIEASRFFFGDDASNVKAILASGMDELTQSGFYKTTDTNMSIIHMQRDADNAMRIWWDPDLNCLYYKYKADGNWTSTNFRILSQDSRLDFNKLDNVPVFAPDVHTHLWADIADKPTVFAPDVHTHLWADITDKPTTFTPGVHSHYWDDILSKPTTFLAAPHDHYSVVSEGLLAEVSGTESITYPGVSMVEAKASNKYVVGTKEGTVLNLKGDAQSQLMVSGNSGAKPSLLIRSKGYGVDEIWSEWAKVFSSQDAPTWSDIASKPTTLAGFGITDGAPLSHVGAGGTAHSEASTSVAGFMSAADKTKLDGVANNANNYVHPTGNGNLHVPSNSGITQGACLASGSTAGALTWVSSIWRSYGVTQIAKTTNNSNLYVNQYTKFLTVTITNRYQDYTTELTAMSGGSGTANNQNSRLNIRVKQQTDFGTDPFIEVFQTQLTPVDRQRYFYSIVQNTPTTIVDFYVMNVESWNHIGLFIQNDLQNGGSVNYLSNQAYTATLPANAVEFSKNRILTEGYHPLADALTTARTLTWTGDATGAMTFNGSANVSSALTLAATGVTAGTYRLVTVDAKGRVTWGTNPTTLAGYGITDAAPSSHVGATDTAHGVATTSVAGFMSAADKTKLDGIVSSGNVNTASSTNVPNIGSIAFVSRTISANNTVPTINYGDWVAGSAFKVASINGGSATQACTGTWKALSYFVGVGGNSSEVIQYGLAIRVA